MLNTASALWPFLKAASTPEARSAIGAASQADLDSLEAGPRLPDIESHPEYLNIWLDSNRRPIMAHLMDGTLSCRLSANSIPTITYNNLASDIRGLLPSVGEYYQGFPFALIDPTGRSYMHFTAAGKMVARLEDSTVTTAMLANGAVTAAKLDAGAQAGFPTLMDYNTGTMWALVDTTNRPLMHFTAAGKLVARFEDNTITAGALAAGSVTASNFADGSVTNPKLASLAVSREKLDGPMNRQTSNSMVAVMTDAVRTDPLASIGFRSTQSWSPLPERITPSLIGVNTTGTTLEFRENNGLLIKGYRRVGTYDQGPVFSVTYKDKLRLDDPWPPAGTFVSGDYYDYVSIDDRVIGPNTLKRGDLMIYNGASWVYKASPGYGATRYEWDWWEVTSDGYFMSIPMSIGDRLVYVGTDIDGGYFYTRFRKGRPDLMEFFRCGEFDPAAGLPSSPTPRDGDLWEASAAGTAGGITFAAGDTAVRYKGIWGRVPEKPIFSFPDGSFIHLPCVRSSYEWTMRRANKSLNQVGISMDCYGVRKASMPGSDIVCIGDSMTYFANFMPPLLPGRTVTNRTRASSQARHTRALAEWLISQGDPDKNKTVIVCQGENSINDLPQIQETAEAMTRLCGTAAQRILHISPLGQFNDMYHNGTRFVMPNFEHQLQPALETSANVYARALRYFSRSFPDNYVNFRKTVADAVVSSAIANDKNLQFPGMTYLQVVNAYGIIPWVWMSGLTGMTGVDVNALNYVGLWTTPGLPTGGNPNDYYLRNEATEEGRTNPIINKAGVWTEITFGRIHLGDAGNIPFASGLVAQLNARGW